MSSPARSHANVLPEDILMTRTAVARFLGIDHGAVVEMERIGRLPDPIMLTKSRAMHRRSIILAILEEQPTCERRRP
jgi:hypothetical protein